MIMHEAVVIIVQRCRLFQAPLCALFDDTDSYYGNCEKTQEKNDNDTVRPGDHPSENLSSNEFTRKSSNIEKVELLADCARGQGGGSGVPVPPVGSEYIDRGPDGSYRYGFQTGDEGGHYHAAVASKDNQVGGRFGSRDPATGRIAESQYTAGQRGFRARGPNIARQQDLSQTKLPYNPPVDPSSPNYNPTYDTYHDPNEDPSYNFAFRTPNYVRNEKSDSRGRVDGSYSFVDDVGERHDVRYEAGARIGFNVRTPFPDSKPFSGLFYNGPTKPGGLPRGKTSIQQGGDGSYRFVSAGPDQRRAEVSDALGNVRGSYTYIDDKGQQRTVEYIAGPNIGYKVINKAIGPKFPPIPAFVPPQSLFPNFPTKYDELNPNNFVQGGGAAGGPGSPVGGGGERPGRPGSRPGGPGSQSGGGLGPGSLGGSGLGGGGLGGGGLGGGGLGGGGLGGGGLGGGGLGGGGLGGAGLGVGGLGGGGLGVGGLGGGGPDLGGGTGIGGSDSDGFDGLFGDGGGDDLGRPPPSRPTAGSPTQRPTSFGTTPSPTPGSGSSDFLGDLDLFSGPTKPPGGKPTTPSPLGSSPDYEGGYRPGSGGLTPTEDYGPPGSSPGGLFTTVSLSGGETPSSSPQPSYGGFQEDLFGPISAFPEDDPTKGKPRPSPSPPSNNGGDDFLDAPFPDLGQNSYRKNYNKKPSGSSSEETHDTSSKEDNTFLSSNKNFYGFPPGISVKGHVQSLDILPFGSRIPPPGLALESQLNSDR